MAYTKFDDSPPPEAPASKQPPAQAAPSPKASSSKLVSPTAPAPTPSSTKRPRSPSKPNGHTVHYHSSDEEDAAAAKASLIGAGSAVNGHTAHGLNGNSKKRRKKDKSRLKEDAWVDATNVNGTSNGSTLKGKERLKEERIRLTADRMDLPIWSGSWTLALRNFWNDVARQGWSLQTFLSHLFGLAGQKAIQEAVEKHDTVVILGETGSGKTTRESVRLRRALSPLPVTWKHPLIPAPLPLPRGPTIPSQPTKLPRVQDRHHPAPSGRGALACCPCRRRARQRPRRSGRLQGPLRFQGWRHDSPSLRYGRYASP